MSNFSGNAEVMREAIYDKGVRLTMEEWAEKLFGNPKKTHRIKTIRRKLLLKGFPVVPIPADPKNPKGPGLLTPLTESVETAEYANGRAKASMDSYLETLGLYFVQELQTFPEMKTGILSILDNATEQAASVQKLVNQYDGKKLLQ